MTHTPTGATAPDNSGHSPKFLTLVLCSVLGIALALSALPPLFRSIETDMTRSQVLLRALRANDPPIHTVTLGDSVIMCGIDTRLLPAPTGRSGRAINLSTTGQMLLESLLLYQELPDSVTTVIQAISLDNALSPPELPAQKYNALYLYGYRPHPETAQLAGSIAALTATQELPLRHSLLAQTFQGRWAIRSMIDTNARMLIRQDLKLEVSNDLFFPHVYTSRMAPEKYERTIAAAIAERRSTPHLTALSPAVQEALRSIHKVCERRQLRLAFLIPPTNPRVRGPSTKTTHQALISFLRTLSSNPGASIMDAGDLLEEELFLDARHPSKQGAAILTRFVRDHLDRQR